jgi:hypothetical protein
MLNYNEARDVRSSHSQPADFFKTDVSIDVTTDNIREIHTLIDSPSIKPNVVSINCVVIQQRGVEHTAELHIH